LIIKILSKIFDNIYNYKENIILILDIFSKIFSDIVIIFEIIN